MDGSSEPLPEKKEPDSFGNYKQEETGLSGDLSFVKHSVK